MSNIGAGTGNSLTLNSPGIISASGRIITSNIVVGNGLSSTGNVTVNGIVSAAGNITGLNIIARGTISPSTISTTGNITAGNIRSGLSNTGVLNATGQIVVNAGSGNTVWSTGNIRGANVMSGGIVSATGNISGNYFIGNGRLLTGIVANYGDSNVTSLLSSFGSNSISTSGSIVSDNLFVSDTIDASVVNASVINVTGELTVGSNPSVGISVAGNITGANVSTTGNVTGQYFIGNGSQLTGIATVNYSNSNATSLLASFGSNSINTTGTITAGNVSVSPGGYFVGDGSNITNLGGPAFVSTITLAYSIPASPTTIYQQPIAFNNIVKNVGNGYSSNGIFTAPRSGFYQVSAAFAPGIPTPPMNPNLYYGAGALVVYKNNLPVAAGQFVEAKIKTGYGWAVDSSSISTLVYLNQNDTLQCKLAYITNYTGFTTLANLVPNYFSACWLRN